MSCKAGPRMSSVTLAETLEREGNAEWAQVVREASWERVKAVQTSPSLWFLVLSRKPVQPRGFSGAIDFVRTSQTGEGTIYWSGKALLIGYWSGKALLIGLIASVLNSPKRQNGETEPHQHEQHNVQLTFTPVPSQGADHGPPGETRRTQPS